MNDISQRRDFLKLGLGGLAATNELTALRACGAALMMMGSMRLATSRFQPGAAAM